MLLKFHIYKIIGTCHRLVVNNIQLLLSCTQVPHGTLTSEDEVDMLTKDLVSQLGFGLIHRMGCWLSLHSLWNFTGKNVVSWALADLHKLNWKVTWGQVGKQSDRYTRWSSCQWQCRTLKEALMALFKLPSPGCLRASVLLYLLEGNG